MPFDLSSAKPVSGGGGFDLASASPEGQAPQNSLDLKTPTPGIPDKPKPAAPTSLLNKVAGAGEAVLSAGSSMIAGPVGGAVGAIENVFSGKYGTQAGVDQGSRRASEVARQLTYQPRTQSGQNFMEGIGGVVDATKIAGMNPAQAITIGGIPRPPVSAPIKQMAGKVGRAVADSPEAHMIGEGAKKIGGALRPKVEPQLAELGQKAEAMGIKIPPDMLSDNKFLRILGQASREMPASGSPVKGNREAFNRAIIKAFGGDEKASKITPAVFYKAMNTHGGTIGDISAKNPIPFTPTFATKLRELSANAKNFETADVTKIIESYIDEMVKPGEMAGRLDGEAFRKLRTKLTGQMRRTNNGDLRHALSELDDVMLDAIQEQIGPQDLPRFNQARQFYANGKTVEPLVAKAASKGQGDMSPAALAGRVTASASGKAATARGTGGELANISAVGNRFMTEPGSSLTAERALTYGMLGDLGTLLKAAAMYVPANLYNRLGPAVSRRMIGTPPPQP